MITIALLVASNFSQAQGSMTGIELGAPGMIMLPGEWDIEGHINLLGRFEVEFLSADSTFINLAVDRRDAFSVENDSVTVTSQQFVSDFFKMKKSYSEGIGHWNCDVMMNQIQDRSQEGCIVWCITDNCGKKLVGMYAADDVFIYDFTMRSATMNADEQAQFLLNAFRSLR